MNINKSTITTTFFIGLISAIAFILIQPLFGMSTLTSRHAAAYMNIGGYDKSTAIILSWCVHISVSLFYTYISLLIYKLNSSSVVNIVQIVFLGWVTTLLATPANEWVVKLITTQQLPSISALSALNTEIGPKLWLHIMFFVLIIIGLTLSKYLPFMKGNKAN